MGGRQRVVGKGWTLTNTRARRVGRTVPTVVLMSMVRAAAMQAQGRSRFECLDPEKRTVSPIGRGCAQPGAYGVYTRVTGFWGRRRGDQSNRFEKTGDSHRAADRRHRRCGGSRKSVAVHTGPQ